MKGSNCYILRNDFYIDSRTITQTLQGIDRKDFPAEAYRYAREFAGADGRPLRMCRARWLTYITTSGGYLPENNSLELYWREMCGLLVIPELHIYKAEGLDIYGNDPEKILQEARNAFAVE